MHTEAYNYLRDMLLLILKHQFLAAEESIAVLVCPVLCHAISCLLVYSRHATGELDTASLDTSSNEFLQYTSCYTHRGL